MTLSGNTLLITGGTSGIGLAFAEEFIKAGSKVIITGRRADRLAAIKERLPDIFTKVSDVAQAAHRIELADWIAQQHPETNVLINNAGIQLIFDFTKDVDLHKIQAEIDTNFLAPVHLASLFVPLLTGKQQATIMNVTSGLAFVPIAQLGIYCATKAAMHSITLSQRFQLKDKGIQVFEIIPPSVDTELGHDRREDKTQSHGGMPIQAFIEGAMTAIKNDEYEAAVGQSSGLRDKREQMFDVMNKIRLV